VLAASGDLSEHAAERFEQVKALFDQARPETLVEVPTESTPVKPAPFVEEKAEQLPASPVADNVDATSAATPEPKETEPTEETQAKKAPASNKTTPRRQSRKR